MQAQPPTEAPEAKLKIYFLPNLLTAGNLFCGFVALTKIVEADLSQGFQSIKWALAFILLACIFDLFDGRVARMGGVESAFGREFDSLADLISFGAAPAFLLHRVVLKDLFAPELGWFIASIYLLCGAFRLARFNCLSAQSATSSKEFLGFPIPSAAGLVASLTLLIIQLNEKDKNLGNWKYFIAAVLIFLSAMMVSTVKYPSFKSMGLRSTSTFTKAILAALAIGLVILLHRNIYYILPIPFTLYLVYGFIRPRLWARQIRHEIEEGEDDEEAEAPSEK